jgi:hypothetical protein
MRCLQQTIFGLAILLMVVACSSTPPPDPASPHRNVLMREQVLASGENAAYAVVMELRPGWLDSTNKERLGIVVRAGSRPPPEFRGCGWGAYVDGQGYDLQELRNVAASRIAEIRLIPAGSVRPDGGQCSHRYSAIHVRLLRTP